MCVGQPLARLTNEILCYRLRTSPHQDGAGTASFDPDPTISPVGAWRVQPAKWTVEWWRPSCAAGAVQTCPEQKDTSFWRLRPALLSGKVKRTVTQTYPNYSLIVLSKMTKCERDIKSHFYRRLTKMLLSHGWISSPREGIFLLDQLDGDWSRLLFLVSQVRLGHCD